MKKQLAVFNKKLTDLERMQCWVYAYNSLLLSPALAMRRAEMEVEFSRWFAKSLELHANHRAKKFLAEKAKTAK